MLQRSYNRYSFVKCIMYYLECLLFVKRTNSADIRVEKQIDFRFPIFIIGYIGFGIIFIEFVRLIENRSNENMES